MSKGSVFTQCVVCGGSFPVKLKAGEISIRLSVKGGQSVAVAGPVCAVCAEKSTDPAIALEQMRLARGRLLLSTGAGSDA